MDFIKLTVVDGNNYSGTMYVKIDEIEAFGKEWKSGNSNIKGFIQVNGIKYTVAEEHYQIYSAIEEAQRKIKEKKEAEIKEETARKNLEIKKSLALEGKIPEAEAKKEIWLDEDIVWDKEGKKGLTTRQYKALIRHFCYKKEKFPTWRDIYEMPNNEDIRNLSSESLKEAKSFIKKRLEEIS